MVGATLEATQTMEEAIKDIRGEVIKGSGDRVRDSSINLMKGSNPTNLGEAGEDSMEGMVAVLGSTLVGLSFLSIPWLPTWQ